VHLLLSSSHRPPQVINEGGLGSGYADQADVSFLRDIEGAFARS
jgi:hypothetical protein